MTSAAIRAAVLAALFACGLNAGPAAAVQSTDAARADTGRTVSAETRLQRLPEDETMYFVLPDRFANGDARNDRGGLRGGPLQHGFDPTHKGFYQGGDLRGLIQRLDYIQGLGATAIWLGPIYKNKPVQDSIYGASAGYHGYWITDFTTVDPHFGTPADLRAFVQAAHARGMKVYLDIVTNHTADVIKFRECHDPAWTGERVAQGCPYRPLGEYPYTTRGRADGAPINEGFRGDDAANQTAENFARLTRPDYAYTPFIPAGEENAKTPAWLNDPIYYHNRGETTYDGESGTYGDFAGLDDLFTEHPRVVDGFIDIFKAWITEYRIDGFRVDTAKHVNSEFWQRFVPAVTEHARAQGIPHFHVFGESYYFDPAQLARFTHEDRMTSILDFAFADRALQALGQGKGTRVLAELYQVDAVYAGGRDAARQLPTFLGNHDMGRFAYRLRSAMPDVSADELARRVRVGHALMMFARGMPVIYYGDEQGFVGDGNDQSARETLFASRVESYLDNDLLLTDATHATDNYRTDHPLYRDFADMARIRREEVALRRGRQVVRLYGDEPGLFVFSRVDPETKTEVLVAINTAREEKSAFSQAEYDSRAWTALHGACAPTSAAPGSVRVTVPALDYVVCRSKGAN